MAIDKILENILTEFNVTKRPIPVFARSKARDCGLSLAGIAGSNPAGGMTVCLQ